MSEVDIAVVKPEIMKSYIWIKTADGSVQQVEQEVAIFCPMIYHEMHMGIGCTKNHPIALPQRVNSTTLSLIFDYCRFHQVSGRSNKERRYFDEKYIRMDTKKLCDLTSAADSLQLKPLVDLTSRALARMIEGKSPEEIRHIFNLPDDLTEEEKLEPLKNVTDDPRIRLLNRLYAKKRKELREKEKLKNVETEEDIVDERSVDDLLSFINGANEDSKVAGTSKNKKKNRKRRDQQKNLLRKNTVEICEKDPNGISSTCHNEVDSDKCVEELFVSRNEFDEGDADDEIDPELREQLDREVEDFERRLNSDWLVRMQEILSSGYERSESLSTGSNK